MDIKIVNQYFSNITIVILIFLVFKILKKHIMKKINKKEKSLKKYGLINLKLKFYKKIEIIEKNKVVIYLKKYWDNIIFIILLIIAIFTRIYKITTLLKGLHVDEAGMAYDAFCIANYGVDRYLNQFPIYMINFGGGQSALYTYLAAIFVKLIGLNIVSIRLPGIILSLVAIVAGYKLIKKYYGKKWSLLFVFLMIICPWHFMQSRFGLDCNLLSSMIIISITLLLTSNKWWHYILAGISFGITLYTYALSYIIVPILLLLSLIYMIYNKKIKLKNIVIMGIPIIILSIPLILMLLVNMGFLEQINIGITIPKLFEFRAGEFTFNNIWENLKQIAIILTSDGFMYNSIPEVGTIYLFAIPLVIGGIFITIIEFIKSIKLRKFNPNSILLFLFIANLILICITGVNVNKVNSIYISLLYFVFIMMKNIFVNFKLGFRIIVVMYAIMSIMFFRYYFNQYNNENSNMDLVDNKVIEIVKKIDNVRDGKKIYFDVNVQQPWIYVLYTLEISPYKFNETRKENNSNNIYSFEGYNFSLPEEIEQNAIYIIEEDEENKEFIEKLIKNEFKMEIYSGYYIYTK